MLLFKDIHFDARVQREAIALAETGHVVYIACLQVYNSQPTFLHENIHYLRYKLSVKRHARSAIKSGHSSISTILTSKVQTITRKLFKDIIANIEFCRLIKKDVASKSINVVHCHDLNTLWIGVTLSRYLKTPLIYDSHELFNEMVGKNKLEKRIGYFLEKLLIKGINHLIVVNEFAQHEFLKRYGALDVTILQNIPIVTDVGVAELPKEENYWRKKYNLSQTTKVLLYQGGLTPERGIEESIEALKLLPDEFVLVLLGEGRSEKSLKLLVSSLGLENRVFFHEQVPANHILWYTKQADIGLVVYKNTCLNNFISTPNKIFEYMLAEIPTIASNHPGKMYIVENEQTGICVQEKPLEIKQAVEQIMSNYKFYQDNCRKVKGKYSWLREKQKLLTLYQKLEDK